VNDLNGDMDIHFRTGYVDILFGGDGIPADHYYGIYYSQCDSLCPVTGIVRVNDLEKRGNGYYYESTDGSDRYYAEPLGDHFYYYELHY